MFALRRTLQNNFFKSFKQSGFDWTSLLNTGSSRGGGGGQGGMPPPVSRPEGGQGGQKCRAVRGQGGKFAAPSGDKEGRSKMTFANWKINANFQKFSALRAIVDPDKILTLVDSHCGHGGP